MFQTATDLQPIFRKGKLLACHTGLFSETGPAEMLKASDYNSVNQVFSILGAIADVSWKDKNVDFVIRSFAHSKSI